MRELVIWYDWAGCFFVWILDSGYPADYLCQISDITGYCGRKKNIIQFSITIQLGSVRMYVCPSKRQYVCQ